MLETVIGMDKELNLVGKAKNGEEMCQIIKTRQPDVVLLDLIMPKMDGLTVMERINQEWYEHLEKQYLMLDEEIRFFEAALSALSGYLPEFMTDMVINGCTWDYLCEHYHISRTMVAKNRRKAIWELEELYEQRDAEMVSYMLS